MSENETFRLELEIGSFCRSVEREREKIDRQFCSLVSSFTEFYVDEIDDRAEFLIIVDKYLSQTNIPREYIDRIVNFYFEIQSQVKSFQITSSSTSSNRISVTYRFRSVGSMNLIRKLCFDRLSV